MSCCRKPGSPRLLTPPRGGWKQPVRIRYRGSRAVVVKGPVTGTDYRFSPLDRAKLVDPGDAINLLRSGAFTVDKSAPESSAEATIAQELSNG